MNYVSYNQMNLDVIEWATKLPRFDLICGIPRSGMLVASRLALMQDTSLGYLDPDKGIVRLPSGSRAPDIGFGNILIVDDSAHTGESMDKAKKKLDGLPNLFFGALYVSRPLGLDFEGKLVESPRTFAWNLFNPTVLAESCLDIDGVICRDPEPGLTNWDWFFNNTKALFPIRYPVHTFVTGRVEGRRKQTQDWLWNHGITYHHLKMRAKQEDDIAPFKAAEYLQTNCSLFIESDPVQAQTIAELSGRPVVCTLNFELYGGKK